MNDKFYLGKNVSDFKAFSKQEPITGVFMAVDDEGNGYMAGTEGNVLTVLCHSGNQTMANNLLAMARGFQYQGFSASDAELPIEAELGDGLTVNGLYSMLANQVVNFGGGHLSEVSAPGDDEVDHAYPYVSPEQRAIERKIAQTSAQLTVGLESIRGEVAGKLDADDAQTLIDQNLESITLSASAGTNQSTISITANGVTFDTATVKFSRIVADEVDADNITGNVINIDDTCYIRSGKSVLGYISGTSKSGVELYSAKGAKISSGYDSEVIAGASGVTMYNANSDCIQFDNGNRFRPAYDDDTYLGGYGYRWTEIWAATSVISTSDLALKKDIAYNLDGYDAFFDRLKPCLYRFVDGKSNRRHTGFIAQDIENSLDDCGISTADFAAFIKNVDEHGSHYALRYEEFIALCVDQIQKLKARVKELENGYA